MTISSTLRKRLPCGGHLNFDFGLQGSVKFGTRKMKENLEEWELVGRCGRKESLEEWELVDPAEIEAFPRQEEEKKSNNRKRARY